MENLNIDLISKRSFNGVIALTSRAFFLNVLSYIASLVIFTFLSPKDVGIFVAVTAIQRIISFFTDFGLGAALVQKKEAVTSSEVTTLFTIQSAITLIIFLLIVLMQNVIGDFFHLDPSAKRLLLVLVFTVFVSSFKVIPSILLEREIRFHTLIIPQIVESAVFNVILIVLAMKQFGLDSYVYAFLFSSIISVPFYYWVSPWKIRFGIQKDSLKHLHYGIQFQAKNVLATLKDDFLTIFLSKVLTFTEIGYIGFGQRNAFFIYRYIVDSVTKVTFSTFSRLQHDLNFLRKTIEKSLFYISSITFPILVGLVLIAPYVLLYFPKWHGKWEPALFSLTFFSLNALVSSLSGILVNVLDGTGRVKTTLRLMTMWTFLTWILTPLLIHFMGYNGVSLASFLVTLTLVVTVFLVKKHIPFSFWNSIVFPVVSTIIMGVAVYLLSRVFISSLTSLFGVILLGGVIYLVSLYLFTGSQIKNDFKAMH